MTLALVQQQIQSLTAMVDQCRAQGMTPQSRQIAHAQIDECWKRAKQYVPETQFILLRDRVEEIDMPTLASRLPSAVMLLVFSYKKDDFYAIEWTFQLNLSSRLVPCLTLDEAAGIARTLFSNDPTSQSHILSRIAIEQLEDGEGSKSLATARSIPKKSSSYETLSQIAYVHTKKRNHAAAKEAALLIPEGRKERNQSFQLLAVGHAHTGEHLQAKEMAFLVTGAARIHTLQMVSVTQAKRNDHTQARETLLLIPEGEDREKGAREVIEYQCQYDYFEEAGKTVLILPEGEDRDSAVWDIIDCQLHDRACEGAKNTALLLSTPAEREEALQQIQQTQESLQQEGIEQRNAFFHEKATSYADKGRYLEAKQAAVLVAEGKARNRTLLAVAVSQARRDDHHQARETLLLIPEGEDREDAVRKVFKRQYENDLFEEAEKTILLIPSGEERDSDVWDLIEYQVENDYCEDAKKTALLLSTPDAQAEALQEIAQEQASRH